MQKIIDPHIHLFNLGQGDYQWLKPDNPPFWPDKELINKNFTESDLELKAPLSLENFVHIEAGFDNQFPVKELEWLETHCDAPLRTIAFVDISLPANEFEQAINQVHNYSSCIGIRHILDEDANKLLSSKSCLNNLAQLADYGLLFELQMPIADKNAVTMLSNFAAQQPKLKIIIDHAGWPPNNNLKTDWLNGIKALAQYPDIAIKCSGWEMADENNRHYSDDWQWQVINECLNHFGEHRVMLASNFPLTLFAKTYQNYWQDLVSLLKEKQLAPELINKLCVDNAHHWYQF